MGTIKFRMAARCEAAGRLENEDNYLPCDDLSKEDWGFTADNEILLGKYGALIVVCDGMGGMNAGEVASALAVSAIKKHFTDNNLEEVVNSPASIKKFIEKAIIFADTAVKEESRADSEKAGMGSTIVLAWFVENMVYVGWCGDSRAYRYNVMDGLVQLSHDHSYVQELVDAGKLSEELAFDHPNNNIITRSLGDPNRTAKPDIKEFQLRDGDIIMLCTDGLNGVLRDHEMQELIANNSSTMTQCRDALWEASREAGWNDNVTIGLCQILSGTQKDEAQTQNLQNTIVPTASKKFFLSFGILILIALLCTTAYFFYPKWFQTSEKVSQDTGIVESDSLQIISDEIETEPEQQPN